MTLVLFFVSFAVYLVSMPGTIPSYRDSGDLIVSIGTLGIAHPPGYPLYVLLGNLFTRLFAVGTLSYRVNAFSAFAAALSVGLVFLACREFCRRFSDEPEAASSAPILVGSTAAAVLYAASPAVFHLARVAEMYTLAGALAAGILWAVARGTRGSLTLAGYLLGLGAGVHPTLIFLSPLVIFGWTETRTSGESEPDRTRSEVLFRGLVPVLLGFSVVLFLPVRAATGPLQNWGNPSTWEFFWRVLTRADYGGLRLHPEQSHFVWTAPGILDQLHYFWILLRRQGGWAGILLIFAGGLAAVRRFSSPGGRTAGALLLSWGIAGPGFFILSNLPLKEATTGPILEPSFVLTGVLGACLMAPGWLLLWRGRGSWGAGRRRVAAGVLTGGLLALAFVPGREQVYRSARRDFVAYDYARDLLRSLPARAVLYDPDDQVAFAVRVLQVLEGRRPDVIPLNFFRTRWGYAQLVRRWPDLLPPGPVGNARDLERLLWSYSFRRFPFFVDLPAKLPEGMAYQPCGLAYRVLPAEAAPGAAPLPPAEYLFERLALRHEGGEDPDFFVQHVMDYYAAAQCNFGVKAAEAGRPSEALFQYRQSLRISPRLAAAYNNIGSLAYARNDVPQALRYFRLALRFDPDNEGFARNVALVEPSRNSAVPNGF